MKYTLFVDESGDSGVSRVRSDGQEGATPYMVLAGVLVPDKNFVHIREKLLEIQKRFNKKSLHCNRLTHEQKIFLARTISNEQILCFATVSLKKTLGDYQEKIGSDNRKFYNKCAQYLFEKVGKFMKSHELQEDDLSIVFEKGNFDYDALRSLIFKCRENPIFEETQLLKYIQPKNISAAEKASEPLLQLADITAHAIFKCVDKNQKNYGIPEPRYAKELLNKFFCDPETKKIDGFGVKAIHKLSELDLDDDIKDMFINSISPRT